MADLIDFVIEVEREILRVRRKRQGGNLDLSTLRKVEIAVDPGIRIIDLEATPVESPIQPVLGPLHESALSAAPASAVTEPDSKDPEAWMRERWRKDIPREYAPRSSNCVRGVLCGRP